MRKEKISAVVVFLVIIVCMASFFGVGSRLKYDFGDAELHVICKEYQVAITYADVNKLELVDVENYGIAVDGGSDRSYRWGEWENEQWGRYFQCTTVNTDYGISLETNDGTKYFFNYEGDRSTEELYELFRNLLESKGYVIE